MKKLVCVSLLISSALCSAAFAEANRNPLFYDTFWDANFSHWQHNGGIAFQNNLGHCDTEEDCVKGSVALSGEANLSTSKTISVTAGKRYYFAVWAKAENFQGTAGLNIVWYDANERIINTQAASNLSAGSYGWKQFMNAAEADAAPAGAVFAQLQIVSHGNQGKLWIDDVFFGDARPEMVNTEEYFFASDPRVKNMYIGGSQIVEASGDPDGFGRTTFLDYKFNGDRNYEVYQVDNHAITNSFEVSRGNKDVTKWNFRRVFDANNSKDSPGRVHMMRKMMPGGQGFLETHYQRRFLYIPDSGDSAHGHYEEITFDPNSKGEKKSTKKVKASSIYESVRFADVHFSKGDTTGLGITQVLRLNSEWKNDGSAFESYDYARGIGNVNWRLSEALWSVLSHPASQMGANIYTCGSAINNTVYLYVESTENGTQPVIYYYDEKSGQKTDRVETFPWQSYWLRNQPASWYIVCRDRSREDVFAMKQKTVTPDYSLPEAGAGKNISLWQQVPMTNEVVYGDEKKEKINKGSKKKE
jgi:hypothetical protein